MSRRLSRTRRLVIAEFLESRRLLCALHGEGVPEVVEIGPVDPPMQAGVPAGASDPADIIWTNRANTTAGGAGDTDGFGATFGNSAPIARGVVDAVIVAYERMIGTFNYSSAGQTYSLSLSMSGSGFGASASLSTSFGGKPKSGSISMGTGNNSANANDDNGWFLDTTPYDSSEFLGNLVNAYSADASGTGSGGSAVGRGDFYTVVAAEMTHCMGLFGSALSMWSSHTTNTGASESAAPPGFLWVFQGPSIKHLLTSDNAGSQDFGSAVHSSEPGNSVVFGGDTYIGAQDQGNAFYETGRRYMINNAFALMFKDSYAYGTVDPAKYGTMYSVLNESTGVVSVRGGASTSADTITITNTGSKVTVSVDIGTDVPGTGALPGAGNLPAFVTEYDVSQISSISINTGEGNDIININSIDNATPITIVGDTSGNDTINIGGGVYENVLSNITVNGGGGTDNVVIDDTLDTGNDTYNFNGTSFSKTGGATTTFATVEGITLKANGFDNTINVTAVASGMPFNVQAGLGNDIVNVGSTNISSILAQLTIDGGGQNDALNILDSGFAGATTYSLSPSNIARSTNAVSINYSTFESIAVSGSSVASTYNLTTATGVPVLVTTGAGVDSVNVNETAVGGAVTLAPSSTLDQVTVNSDNTGQATLLFNASTALGSLSIGSGGLVSLQLSGKQAISTQTLSFSGTGQLDLNDDGLILDYSGASPLAGVEPAILSGWANGAWNGPGIMSSFAASTPNRSVGYGEASPLGYAAVPFMGLNPDATSLLFRYTTLADASLDGSVDSNDFNAFVGGYGLSSSAPQPMWAQGNFDFDPKVNTVDFNYLAGQFGIVLPGPLLASTTGVPSPAIFSNQTLGDNASLDLLA